MRTSLSKHGDLWFLLHFSKQCLVGGRIIQRHNELRDLEAELIRLICNGVETETVLQEVTGKKMNGGANTAPNARLDIVAGDSGRGTGRLTLGARGFSCAVSISIRHARKTSGTQGKVGCL